MLSLSISNFIHKYILDDLYKNVLISETLQPYLVYLKKQIKKPHTNTPLVIFDIDGTLIDFFLQQPIEPTIDFYQNVVKMGYHTVLLTARSMNRESETIELIHRYGIKNYDEIIFRQPAQEQDFGSYKLKQRKKLATKYEIVANVGDSMSDFYGGWNGKIIKIPS